MGAIVRTVIFLMVCIIAGCAPTPPPVPTPRPVPERPLDPDFKNGEQAFEANQYPEALASYNRFLGNSYDDPFIDVALFKIGKIYQWSGRDDDAVAVFSRLGREFPESQLIPEARLETLKILFRQERFESVVRYGTAYAASVGSPAQQQPFLSIVADAYAAMGANLDAARIRYGIWQTASGEHEAVAWTDFKHAVEQLGSDDLQQLITQVTEQRPLGLMLYRLGMAFILDEKYDDALDALNAFVERFPDHPHYQDASDMILSLVERARFTPFTIGCVLPLSGPYAIFGQRALNGIELALNQIGATGEGIPFRLIVRDSRSDSVAAAAAVDALDQQKVGAILGPMSAAESASSAAQSRGIPIIVFTQREGVPDIGPYVLRNFITPHMQVRSLVAYAVEMLGAKRFAILYPDENYGWRYMNLFWDQVLEKGGVVNAIEAYDPASTDFANPIKKMAGLFYDIPRDLEKSSMPAVDRSSSMGLPFDEPQSRQVIDDPVERLSGLPLERRVIDDLTRPYSGRDDQWHPIVDFDAVFIPDAPKKAGLVIPQLAYYDIRDVYLLGTNLWNSRTLLEMSGEYMKGTVITDGFFADSQSQAVQDFVAAFQNTYGSAPGFIEAVAYDSAMLLLQTMRRTATDSRRDLKQALLHIDAFDGVAGRTVFEPNGEADKTLYMLQIQRGRFVEVRGPSDPEPAADNQ